MLKKKLVIACMALLLAASWGSQAEISFGASPAKTRQSLDSHMTALKSLFPNLQGTAVDHASGAAVLTVFASNEDYAEVLSKQPEVETLLGAPVRIIIIGTQLKQQQSATGAETR